jgi:hypothetical protein
LSHARSIDELTVRWSPPPTPGPTAFVVFAYHGRDRDAAPSGLLERFESPAARGHRIVHRDHYANPRSLDYLLRLVSAACPSLCSDTAPDLVLDREFERTLEPEQRSRFDRVEVADVVKPSAWSQGPLGDLDRYANVVLVYADALGLGVGAAERLAVKRCGSVLVINGRRRAFRMTRRVGRRVELSRFLAHTRVVERGFALVVRPLAALLASVDALVKRG